MRVSRGAALGVAAVLFAPAVARATPAATVATTYGTPTASVTIGGTGFDPSTSLDVYFDRDDLAIATSSASGVVSVTLTVPASAQPGKHWITLDEGHGRPAAQVAYSVRTDWLQSGFGPGKRGLNPFENTISSSTAPDLAPKWNVGSVGYNWFNAPVIYGGRVFAQRTNGSIYAYTTSGSLQWTANTASAASGAGEPAVAGGRVFFADDGGVVYAYAYNCRTDGGVCTPLWQTSTGATMPKALTLRNGLVYVPSSDGTIHVLSQATGAAGVALTPFGLSTVTTPVSLELDQVATSGGNAWSITRTDGSAGSKYLGSGVTAGPTALAGGSGYYLTSDAVAHWKDLNVFSSFWDTTLSGSGCTGPVAVARNVVYVATCTTTYALDAASGAIIWSAPGGSTAGVTVANGVVYGCDTTNSTRVVAYDANYGTRLWTATGCSATPRVADGVLYTTGPTITAYSTAAANVARRHATRPDPATLRPDPRLHRRHRHR